MSADPILEQYLDGQPNDGVFNPLNLGLYSYSYDNPVKYSDPDGNFPIGKVVELLAKGGEKFVRWISSKPDAVAARGAGENGVMETKQQARQVERSLIGGDPSKTLKHKGHELKDGSTGRPHYQAEGKKGHSFWGKLSGAGAAVGVGLYSDDASADEGGSEGGITSGDVVNFLMDIFVPGGVRGVCEGSDIVPQPQNEHPPMSTD